MKEYYLVLNWNYIKNLVFKNVGMRMIYNKLVYGEGIWFVERVCVIFWVFFCRKILKVVFFYDWSMLFMMYVLFEIVNI